MSEAGRPLLAHLFPTASAGGPQRRLASPLFANPFLNSNHAGRKTRLARPLVVGAILAASAGLLSACSTADGLLAEDRIDLGILTSAANDVVLENGYAIQSAPVCATEEGSEVTHTCAGLTVQGKTIDVSVTGPDSNSDVAKGTMVVYIGPEQIFRGQVQDVLDQRMLATN